MQEEKILKEVTNYTLNTDQCKTVSKSNMAVGCHVQNDFDENFEKIVSESSQSSEEDCRPSLEQILQVNLKQVNFGECLPGSIHEKTIKVTLKQDLEQPYTLSFAIICNDETLNDCPELIFGIKEGSQSEYYDDYRIRVQNKKMMEFKIGVKTPMYYHYDVQCILVIQLEDYVPLFINLKQVAQVPEIVCPKQLCLPQFDNARVTKLSILQNKSKKEYRMPFKLNHNITTTLIAEIIGLDYESIPLIDVKPKIMTLSGKGQFSVLITANSSAEIQSSLSMGKPYTVRRILTFTLKQTKFIYHFPIQIIYHPAPDKVRQINNNKD